MSAYKASLSLLKIRVNLYLYLINLYLFVCLFVCLFIARVTFQQLLQDVAANIVLPLSRLIQKETLECKFNKLFIVQRII